MGVGGNGPAQRPPGYHTIHFPCGGPQSVHWGNHPSMISCFLGPNLGPPKAPGPPGPKLGPWGRAKFGHARFCVDPQKFLRVGPGPGPAKIWSTLRNLADFRPSDFSEGRLRADIQAWGMGSGRFLVCPRPARPPEKGEGLAQICHGTILPDPQVPHLPLSPQGPQASSPACPKWPQVLPSPTSLTKSPKSPNSHKT